MNTSLAALVLFAACMLSPVVAQAQPAPGSGTVSNSGVGGLGFVVPAVRSNDGQLLAIGDLTADRLGYSCIRREAFEWPGVGLDAEAGQKLHLAIDRTLRIEGYNYSLRELPEVKEPEDPDGDLKGFDQKEIAAFDEKLQVYFSENSDRRAKDPLLLIIWYREADDLHLILCSAKVKPAPREED